MDKMIKRGKAPRSIIRPDVAKTFGEQPHIHFSDGSALNMDGTWKHGGRALTNEEKEFLREWGWNIP
jgi:hypothetical protein